MNNIETCRRIEAGPADYAPPRDDLVHFLKEAGDGMMKLPPLIETEGRAIFIGDIHGDLARARAGVRLAKMHDAKAIFLGDYVDRGIRQQETVNYLLASWLLDPENVILLRGNHEFKGVNMKWGFADSVVRKYDETVYWLYNCVFMGMPHAVLLNGNVFGVHGGISPEIYNIADINKIQWAGMDIHNDSMGHLWNDPSEDVPGISKNTKRKVFFTFGPDVFEKFMADNGLELFIRAHQKQVEGVRFFFDNRLVSVFSSAAPYYHDVSPKAVLVEEDANFEILAL